MWGGQKGLQRKLENLTLKGVAKSPSLKVTSSIAKAAKYKEFEGRRS